LHLAIQIATLIGLMNRSRGKNSVIAALVAITALTLGTGASAEQPLSVGGEYIEMGFNAGFSPKALSRTTPTPIALVFGASPHTVDGSHPPALQELTIRFDRSLAIDTMGLPVCNPHIQYQLGVTVAEACKTSVVGKGSMNVEIAFPEEAPITSSSKMILWNGGTRAGVTTLLAAAYLTVPTPATMVFKIEIRKIHEGRLGTEMRVSIPKIAGGSGSVTHFEAIVNRRFSQHGEPASVATLKCPDGKIQTSATASFADGTLLAGQMVRTCGQRTELKHHP
jgi:hypothetical protein